MIKFPSFYWIITVNTKFGNGERVEFLKWEDYSFEQFSRWKWYFKYRAALLQVQYPKYHVESSWGKKESEGRTKEDILKSRIRSKKAKITEFTRKLNKAVETWDQLFPIENDLMYKKAVGKLDRLKMELLELQNELKND